MSSEKQEQPTVITLDSKNSLQILSQYVEVAQQKGAYLLNEAELLKRAMEVSLNNVPDNEIDLNLSKQLLIQGVHKGQRQGAYTLNDAALLSKVVAFVSNTLTQTQVPAQTQVPVQTQAQPQNHVERQHQVPVSSNDTSSDELFDLAEPIPLKPKEV